jgi:hypothetical protein
MQTSAGSPDDAQGLTFVHEGRDPADAMLEARGRQDGRDLEDWLEADAAVAEAARSARYGVIQESRWFRHNTAVALLNGFSRVAAWTECSPGLTCCAGVSGGDLGTVHAFTQRGAEISATWSRPAIGERPP